MFYTKKLFVTTCNGMINFFLESYGKETLTCAVLTKAASYEVYDLIENGGWTLTFSNGVCWELCK